jgi:sporulation protein YtfJ
MDEYQIEKLMDTAMSNIKGMVDVNTIVGDPVETAEGSVIIPISRVSFGFAAGGGELDLLDKKDTNKQSGPFVGGSGAGVMLNPVAFLVVTRDQVRLLPVGNNAVIERLVNTAPELLQQIQKILEGRKR